jgi:4-hydroxybenzoate polyprenyltransferase
LITRTRLIADAVIFRHTLFSLPFAILAVLLETDGRPALRPLLLIILAAAAARNAANALNRVIDARIDAQNPRTAGRHIPSGKLTKRQLLIFAAGMAAIVVVAAAMLNPLCVMLLPVAAVLIGGYSYAKRFTWLCHWWLGVACAAAPMGAFLALSGRFELRYFFLAGAVALWVAGFDILYALQDLEHDRREGLHSVPARFGAGTARLLSALSHLGTVAGLAVLPLFWNLSWLYLAGLTSAAILLVAEHIVVRGGTERHVRIASYTINEIIPLVLLACTAADIYLVGRY